MLNEISSSEENFDVAITPYHLMYRRNINYIILLHDVNLKQLIQKTY